MKVTLPNVDSFKSDQPIFSSSSLNGAGILVVDEDPAFQLGLKMFFKEYVGFHEVFTARNGVEALQTLEKEKSIKVVTLDYQMPGMNGIEVLRRLHANPPHPLGVLMITGYPSDQLEEEFHNLGTSQIHTTHFLSKPVEFDELEPLILSAHDEVMETERLAAAMAEAEAETKAKEAKEALALSEKKSADKDELTLTDITTRKTGILHDPTGPISPIAAAALFAQRDPTEPVPFVETSNPELSHKLDELHDKVAHLENEVSRMAKKTPSIQERFWLDVLKFVLLAAVAFGLYQCGIFQKIGAFLQPDKPASEKVMPTPKAEPAVKPMTPAPAAPLDGV